MVNKLSAALVAMSFVAIAQPAVGQTAPDVKVPKPAFLGKPAAVVKPAVVGKPVSEAEAAKAAAEKAAADAAAAKEKAVKAIKRAF